MSRVSFCLTCVLCHAQQTPAKIHRYATSFSSPAADGGIDFLLPFSRAGRSPFPSQRVRTIAISQPLKSNEIQANAYSQILVNRPMRMWYVVAVESPNEKSKKEKKEHRIRRRMGGWGGCRYSPNPEHLARKGTQGARFGARNVAGGRRTFVCTVQEGLVDCSRLWRGRDEKRASGGTSFSGTLQRNFTRNSGNLERCWNCRFEAGPDSVQGRRNAARGFKSTITNRGVPRNVEFRYRATKKPPCSLFGSQLHCRLVCNNVVSVREAT